MDISPPRPGAVKDSPLGEPDRDFQQSLQLHVHWEGFFDHESGVLLYKYGLSENCLSMEDFSEENEQVRRNNIIQSSTDQIHNPTYLSPCIWISLT